MKNKPQKSLGVMSIALMSVAGIFSLRTLPMMAEYGFSSVTIYIIVAICFFLPSALICAELATAWPETGGMYVWIRQAFGARIGFLGIWLEWTNTVISFPASLAFVVATLAYTINPHLANNKFYMLSLMLFFFWGMTFINFRGIHFSSLLSNIGLLFGTLIPCGLLLFLGVYWMWSGHHLQTTFSVHALVPNFAPSSLVFVAGLILGFSGMQVSAFHAREVHDPQRNFPKAMFIAGGIILVLSIFGSLTISAILPKQEISLVAGLIQTMDIFFTEYHLPWLTPIVAMLIVLGTVSMINLWLIGPCKGLLATAHNGDLPKIFRKTNQHGAPTTLLIMQAIVGSLFSIVYLYMPSINSSYWILLALTSLLTLLMWIFLFSAAIRLRYSHPEVKRSYQIPLGKFGIWLTAGLGIMACVFAFFVGFVPPLQLVTGNVYFYESFLIGGVLIVSIIPFLLPNLGKNREVIENK